MEAKKSLMPQNFKNDINWIIDAYELAKVTFPDGFQKMRFRMQLAQEAEIAGQIGSAESI